jgi:hypothetical protein
MNADQLLETFYAEPMFRNCQVIVAKENDLFVASVVEESGRVMAKCHGDSVESSIVRVFRLLGFHETIERYLALERKMVEKLPSLIGKMELLDIYASLHAQIPDEDKPKLTPSFFWDINKVIRGCDYLRKRYNLSQK